MNEFGKRRAQTDDSATVASGFITAVTAAVMEQAEAELVAYERTESRRLSRLLGPTVQALPHRALLREHPSAVDRTEPSTLVTPHNGPNTQPAAHSHVAVGLEVAA